MGFKPLSTRGESYATMNFEDKSKYYFQNQNILRGLDEDSSAKDMKFWLNDAAENGILFYRDGRAVAPVEIDSEYEKLMEGHENITSGVFLSDLVLVNYDPHSDKQRFDYHPVIVSNGDIVVNYNNPLTEEELDQKYKEADAPQEQREVSFGDNPFATDVDPFGRPGMPQDENGHNLFEEDNIQQEKEDSFDVDYAPTGFNGKEFTAMTRAEQDAYNKDVAAIIDDLAKPHGTNDAEFHEILLNACKHGMLFYPTGNMVTEQTLEATLERISYEPNSDRAANTLTDFIVVEYNPVTEDITDRRISADDNSVYMDKDHPLEVEEIYKEKHLYEQKIARQEARIAQNAAGRVAFQEAVEEVDVPEKEPVAPAAENAVAVEENAPVEEPVVPAAKNAVAVEENAAKLFEFTRPVAVENERHEMHEKRFDDMSPDEQRQFFYRNETVLRGLDASENAEDVSLWLNDAANRGILFYRDGSPVPTTAIDNEIQKVWDGRKATGEIPFLSDLVFANYNPDTQALGFHPLYVVDGKINVFSERPLTEVEMQYEYEDYAKALKNQEELKAAEAERINNLSPKELVEELAESVRALNSIRSNAITNQLKELGLYQDLSYTTSDGAKHEKGTVNVDGQVYLRGETTPATPEKLVRYVEGVQPPKKPSGFFSGVREWWHKNVSKLDDFTKYEDQTKEYEITKYYTCMKAGLNVAKPTVVEQYERETAVDLYLDANFENLVAEWSELTHQSAHGPLTKDNVLKSVRDQFKEKLLNDNYLLRDFIKTPEMQKILSEKYGANFKLFGENGRKVPAINENEKAALSAAGAEIGHRNQWSILSKFASNSMDKDVYTVMSRVADSYDVAKNNLTFMKDLETALRKNTPMADHIRESLLKYTPKQLSDFYYSCTNYHKNDAPYSIEMAAADGGILTDTMTKDLLDEKCANWLKPLDELTAFSTEEEKDFFNDFKAAFTKYPHIAKAAARDFGPLDENFIKRMAPAVEQYAQVKGFKGIKELGALGVLEVIAHNGLFNKYSSQEVKKDVKETVNPAFERKALWQSVNVENWTQDFNKFSQNQKTQEFIADFRAAVISNPDIGEKIMNEHKTIDQDFVNKLTSAANDYSKSGKLGELGTLAAAGKTGLFKEETVKAIDEACKSIDKDYNAPKKAPNEMSAEERLANAVSNRQAMDQNNVEYAPINQNGSDNPAEPEQEPEAEKNDPQMGTIV